MKSSLSLSFHLNRWFLLVSILLWLFTQTTIIPSLASAAEAQSNNETSPSQSAEIEDTKKISDRDLAQLTPKTTKLTKTLLDMQNQLNTVHISDKADQLLTSLIQQEVQFKEQVQELEKAPKSSRLQLTSLQIKLKSKEREANLIMKEAISKVAKLDYWIDFWNDEKNDIENWKKGLGASVEIPAVITALEQLEFIISQADETINAKLLPLFTLQQKAGSAQVALHESNLRLGNLIKNKFNFDHHTSYLFSSTYFNEFDSQLWKGLLAGAYGMFTPDFSYLVQNKNQLLFALILFVMLSTNLKKHKQTMLELPRQRFIGEHPHAVALLVSLMFLVPLVDTMTPFWLATFRIMVLLNMLILCRVILPLDTYKQKVIKWIILLLLLTNILKMIALPMVLLRIYILVVSLAMIVVVLLFIRRLLPSHDSPVWLPWCGWAMVMALGFVIFTQFSGKPDLSYHVFVALFKTVFVALWLYILYLSVAGLLEIGLKLLPLHYLQENAVSICAALRPLLIIVALIALIINILVAWEIYPTIYDALIGLGGLGFTVVGTSISAGLVLSAILILYIAYSTSRMIQAILLSSVLPRQNIHRGTQISIVRLLHYSVMLMGLLFALAILGFNMTNLTILGGAVGVGIGFGLQAIFSNFAAGLILLLERPIKVGDTIRIGTELGEVKELGLRATVIETFDNAEIVVPNSELVTTQVTNWTLRKRQVRVKLPVGVAYDSKVDQVLSILEECANRNPLVLSTPQANAIFLAFGDNSLDFELRCYVTDIDNRMKVQSELNAAIFEAFASEGIEIPFPQSDIHLKSITPNVTKMVNEIE